MTSAAFFDLDRTLLQGASGPIISEALRAEGLLSPDPVPGENLLFLLLHDINRPVFCREMKRFDGMLFESTADDAFDDDIETCLAVEL